MTLSCRVMDGTSFLSCERSAPDFIVQQVNLEDFNPSFPATGAQNRYALSSLERLRIGAKLTGKRWRGNAGRFSGNTNCRFGRSCGGAQGLAILATVGVDQPWDCPHCRDELHPLVPIYSHIGHTAQKGMWRLLRLCF